MVRCVEKNENHGSLHKFLLPSLLNETIEKNKIRVRTSGIQKLWFISFRFEPRLKKGKKILSSFNNVLTLYNSVPQKKTSRLAQKSGQHSVAVGDIQNNPMFADFWYHIRMMGFLALQFQIFAISVYFF